MEHWSLYRLHEMVLVNHVAKRLLDYMRNHWSMYPTFIIDIL